MNAFNGEKWSSEFSATFGAYDIEKQDLFITVSEPTHGRIMISKGKTSVPNLETCPPYTHVCALTFFSKTHFKELLIKLT